MIEPQNQNEAACGGSALTAELGADFDRTEEQYILEMLVKLGEHYERMRKPWLDRLASIHAHRLPPPITLTWAQIEAMGIKVPNA